MEEDNHSSADEFEHVEETGVDDQVLKSKENEIEMLISELRAEISAVKIENKVLGARLDILEKKPKINEVVTNVAKQEIVDKKIEKQSNDIEQEEQRKLISEQMADKEEKLKAELEQMAAAEHLDQQVIVDFEGKMAALETEVLTAMEKYLEPPNTMQAVLKKICGLYRDGTNLHCHSEALDLVLRALEMHLGSREVQIVGIASMLAIKGKMEIKQDTKERVIQALIAAMAKHVDSLPLVQQCCSGLFNHFDIPQDVLFVYSRVAKLLLKVLVMHESYSDTVISQLYKMSLHVESKQRIEMGETGAIEIMLKQISRKLQANTCDYVMENCWSFLWNFTNGSPANCERILKTKGLELFSQSYTKFANKNPKLVRQMLGLIGNIAVRYQSRDQLMTNGYLEIFCKLLDNLLKDNPVSYMSARVLAHLISDSDEHWTKSGVTLSRDQVSVLIIQAIEKWDLHAPIHSYINYGSLKSTLRLLTQWHAIGSQHWAVWALANLTATDEKKKYCRMVAEEEGMKLLEQLKTDSRSTDAIRQLACTVIKNVEDWKNNSPED